MAKGLCSLFLVVVAVSSSFGKPEKQTATPQKEKKFPQTLSRGWGDELTWTQTYEEALFRAKSSNKPLMIIHHLEDCPHSQALKKVFANNKEVQKMANEDFILLNLVYETTDKHLSPDGQYVPRIIFVDPSLTVRADITGRYANRLYAYEPSDINLLISNMQKAKKLLKTEL
ncbi:anterior gradient protein 2 homolog [Lepisosteus oculatus]|uniref:Anterior gradient 2 n=1 Tax=Lepisosteus oculatus TaxID=7918 RepID=W5MZX7_LEPOC|nr:PREDICTED: anterior gradient protein 2 homolog [Lepisosteus oculatus]